MSLRRRILKAETPCHAQEVRLTVISAIPQQRYERTCAACGLTWDIHRQTLTENFLGDPESRVDKLEWTVS